MRLYAHPGEVQPIGVPAGQHGGVPVAVQSHRLAQALERGGVEFVDHALTVQPDGEVRRPRTVCRVVAVVVPLTVVQKREPGGSRRVHVQ